MATYQVRLPEYHTLETWLDEVNWLLWYGLMHHAEVEEISPHAFVRMRQIIRDMLERSLNAYSDCGLWEVCRVGTAPGPWMSSADFRPDDTGVRWFILEINGGVDQLVTDVTREVEALLGWLMREPVPREHLQADVAQALRKGIGPYLWQNPNCRAHPLCFGALKRNPWVEVKG